MKKRINLLLLVVISLNFISCEEDFNPYAELKDEYHLYCILRDDTNFQTAKIIRSYAGENLSPDSLTEEPFVERARIWIRSEEEQLVFKEGFAERNNENKYGNTSHYYYLDNFRPNPNLTYEIEAVLPNGLRLTSSIEPTPAVQFMWVNSQKIFPPADLTQTAISYQWNQSNIDDDFQYIARLNIIYSKENSPKEYFPVPFIYMMENDSTYGIYRTLSPDNFISFRNVIINEAMEKLSESEPLKNKFTVYGMEFEVCVLNRSLNNYYQSTILRGETISLVLNENYYTNIENGKGIFGLQAFGTFKTILTQSYVNSFGYNYSSTGGDNER
ncbi:MAG: DUF4249 domain-containing protein [Bacteroidetes bacterium]|nr:DUF4249 domain-containing protein [Bacteroidota bacterium]